MDTPAAVFNTHRQRLFGIAYRMLGSRAEAEDVLQDAYLRWHETDTSEIRTPEAWLVTSVTRLAIDRLRTLKTEREDYPGDWLPEPLVGEGPPTPEGVVEMASDVSMAFLMVMERLAPEERAAFLLREVFEVDYPEVAQMLGKSEATVRQSVHRARERVRESKPRFAVSRAAHIKLLERFVAAARGGDRKDLAALFADDVRVTGDGGGKVTAILRPLHGTERVVRFFQVIDRQHAGLEYRLAEINGAPSLLRYINGKLDAAQIMVTDGVKILEIYIVRNPDKLQGIAG